MAIERHRLAVGTLPGLDAPRPRPLGERARQTLDDVPLAAGLARGLRRLVDQQHVQVHRARVGLVHLLVVLRGGKDVVRVEAGRVDAPVHGDDRLELRPQVLEEHPRSAALAPQQVAPDLDQEAGLRIARPLVGHLPPALVAGLPEVLVEAPLHAGVVVQGPVPDLPVATVVVPEEGRWGEHAEHLVHRPLDRVGRHLVGQRGILLHQRFHEGVPHRPGARGALGADLLLHHRGEHSVVEAHGPAAQPGAVLAPVPREPQEQAHRALHQVAVVVLAGVPAHQEAGALGGDLARQHARGLRMDAAERLDPLRRVVAVEHLAHQRHHRAHLDLRAVRQLHARRTLERRLNLPAIERPLRSGGDLPGSGVEPVELLLVAAEIAPAQEAPIVHAHEQRQVGLLLGEVQIGQALGEDHLRHRVGEGRVGSDLDRNVHVGVDRRGVHVRRDGDDVAAVVARLLDEVIPGDVRVDRVRVPDQDQLALEEIVHARRRVELPEGGVDAGAEVVDLGLEVRHLEPQLGGEEVPHDLLEPALAGRSDVIERRRALVFDRVDDPVGDLAQRLVPGDALPLALAPLSDPLQRLEDPLLVVVLLAPGGALLAAHRVHVGDARLDGGELAGLLLAHDLAVARVHAPGTAAGVAVHRVAAPRHAVPLPAFAVLVFRFIVLGSNTGRHGYLPFRPHQVISAGSLVKGPSSSSQR